MATSTSPTPVLDLNLQNLANASTVIQGIAYVKRAGEANSDSQSSDPRLQRGWKKLGDVMVTLNGSDGIIDDQELEVLLKRLERCAECMCSLLIDT